MFLNITGGFKVNDPALDLAVISSILSSNVDMPISRSVCLTGEVGLSGEIRPVTRLEQRIVEADKLGFSKIFVPHNNLKGVNLNRFKVEVVEVPKNSLMVALTGRMLIRDCGVMASASWVDRRVWNQTLWNALNPAGNR